MKILSSTRPVFFAYVVLMFSLNLASAQQADKAPQAGVTPATDKASWSNFDWHSQSYCNPTLTITPELKGEYSNVVFYPEKDAVGEKGTLTIKEDNRTFELVTSKGTKTGTLTATTSCGYTAVVVQFDDGKNSGVIPLRIHKIGSREGFSIASLETDRPIVLAYSENQASDFALLICPETYPACWPYRNRCPCEKP